MFYVRTSQKPVISDAVIVSIRYLRKSFSSTRVFDSVRNNLAVADWMDPLVGFESNVGTKTQLVV